MNILLIRPKPDSETIGLQSVMICEPLELMTLKSVLVKNGHRVDIIDMILEKRKLDYFIRTYCPDLVGLTGYISHVNVMKDYAAQVKKINPAITVAVGGVHAEVCGDDFTDEHIDLICKSADDLYQFAGCDDTTPCLPDRNLPEQYRQKYYYLFHNDCALIKTSLGCPYNCNFCFCKEIADYQPRCIDGVIDELLEISQKEVYIVDDDFLFNPERLAEFAAKVVSNGIDKHYLVYGRADFIANNESTIRQLKDIGLKAVIVGIESASQDELDSYNKKTKIEDNLMAVQILKKYDIECYSTVILGDFSKEDFQKLYHYLHDLGLVFVNLQPFTPMPGTAYFDLYKDDLIIPYSQKEKWDMAHLVTKPSKMSIRNYYLEIIKLYYKLTFSPKSVFYIIGKYGFFKSLKLSLGSMTVSWQYIKKVIRG